MKTIAENLSYGFQDSAEPSEYVRQDHAYHEAAHALLAFASHRLRDRIKYIALNGTKTDKYPHVLMYLGQKEKNAHEDICFLEDLARMYAAGHIGEEIYTGRRVPDCILFGSSDSLQMQRILTQIKEQSAISGKRYDKKLDAFEAEARSFLLNNRDALDQLAYRTMREKFLNAQQIEDILDPKLSLPTHAFSYSPTP